MTAVSIMDMLVQNVYKESQNEYHIMDCTRIARRHIFDGREHEGLSTGQGT
jgi:hypothetical protein